MMYGEFVLGTGCKENEHNYGVFKNLEIMYMNSDMTKEEIYEYGKKLVDNSKSEAELRAEAKIKEEIASWKQAIEWCKQSINYYEFQLDISDTVEERKHWRTLIKGNKAEIKDYRSRIRFLTQCLG